MAAVLAHEDVRRNSVRLQRGSPVLTPKYSGPGSALVGGTLIRSRTEPQPDTRRPGQSPNLAPAAGVHHYVQGSGCLSALESAMQLGPRDEELDKDEAAGTATAAPSAALVAAVQRAAKAAKPEALGFSPALAHHRTSPFLRPEEPPAGLVGRRRWASMSEEEMMTGIRRSSKEMHPVDLAAYPSPGMSPTMAPTWRVGRDAAPDAWPGARRRWASLSDDEAASPMLWPMRSPGLHVQRPGRWSQSSTPLLAPTGLAKVSEHAAVESEDFMLPPTPQATPSSSQGPNMSPTSQGKNVPMTPENYPMAWPNWDPNAMGGFPSQVPPAWPQMWIMPRENSGWPQVDVPGYPGMPGVNEMGGYPPVGNHFGWMPMGPEAQMWLPSEANEMPGELSGPWMQFEDSAQAVSAAGPAPAGTGGASWSLVWIGERASRAQASEKEELEQLGFTVKIYRTHDRCSRVLDRKSTLAATTVFLISEAEAAPMLEYLQKRGASGLRVLVEADGYSPEQAWELNKSLPTLEESCAIRVCGCWDEVAAALLDVCNEALYMGASKTVAKLQPAAAVPKAPEKTAGGTEVKSQKEQGENPWTLVWISDQAFKPTAVSLKTQLESLGCQVKGYKTNKNAARALDKKRGLVRTVVMVTAAEALPFLQYLSSRPELASTPVVVEATRGYGSIPKSPSVQVCESFDAAAKAVWTVAHEPGFG